MISSSGHYTSDARLGALHSAQRPGESTQRAGSTALMQHAGASTQVTQHAGARGVDAGWWC